MPPIINLNWENPLLFALFTILTTFGFILTRPPTVQFEHRGQMHTLKCLKETFIFKILVCLGLIISNLPNGQKVMLYLI